MNYLSNVQVHGYYFVYTQYIGKLYKITNE